MKSIFTKRKFPVSLWTWIAMMILIISLVYSCFTFRSILQPTEGFTNSTFNVPIVCGNDGEWDISGDASTYEYVVMGVLLPDGWTVIDSIPYRVVGYSAQDSTVFETGSVLVHRDSTSQTLEDLEGSDAETYWWGAASIENVQMDNLDSLYYTLTIQTDDKTGTFNLKYAIGYSDTPNDTVSGQYPITITTSSSVNKMLKKEISIYPNPASGYIYISYGDILDGELILSDVSGRTLLRKRITSSNESINVSAFKPGIYYATVYADGGKWSDKIIIE